MNANHLDKSATEEKPVTGGVDWVSPKEGEGKDRAKGQQVQEGVREDSLKEQLHSGQEPLKG